MTHDLLIGSPAIDKGDPNISSPPAFDQRGQPFTRIYNGRIDIGAFELQPDFPNCDFDQLNGCDIDDIDALIMEIVAGTNNALYDLTGDDAVDLADRDQWLVDAGA